MAILLPPSIIEKAASRFKQVSVISEQAELESHILNFYEDFNMPMSDLYELIDTIQMGELQEIQEKMDGQNITFTVMDGTLLFFSKGATYKRVLSGVGMNREGIIEKYSWNDSVRDAFVKAYDALNPVAIQFQDSLFQNGRVLVESALLTPENPNTIVYDEPSIRFIQAAAVAPDTAVDDASFNAFVSSAESSANQDFYMGPVPYLRLVRALDIADEEVSSIKDSISSLLGRHGLGPENTMGELVHSMVKSKLSGLVPDQLLDIAAAKVSTGKGSIARPFKKIDPQGWADFNTNILSRRAAFLAESIIPIENIIQRIGIIVIRNIDFTLKASNREDLSSFITSARRAFSANHIIANPKELEGIRVALARIEANENLFEKATEGIVFKWKDGKTRKLTGMFTPINKLRGFFAYGSAKIEDGEGGELQEIIERVAERMLLEGGRAFKDDSGNIITRQNRIPRVEVEPIVSNFVRDVLDPLGMDHVGVGTTVTDFPDVGDIDIVVDAIDAKNLKAKLSSHPDLTLELEEAPGINRLYMLPGGAGVAVLYRNPPTGELIQVDVMPSKGVSLDDVGWMLAGAGAGGVKSRYRNILLSWIANRLSDKESRETGETIKYTYARGVLKKVNGAPMGPRETDPDTFLPMLGISAPKEDIQSFESLVDVMRGDPYFSSILPGFKEYLNNRGHLLSANDQRRSEAEAAVRYIGEDLSEILRSHIRLLLNEETESDDEDALQASGLPDINSASPVKMTHLTLDWFKKNSITQSGDNPLDSQAAQLYDSSDQRFYAMGIPYLLLGYEDAEGLRNEGEMFEQGVSEYTRAVFPGITPAERQGGEGVDLFWNNVYFESKKSRESLPTLMFNSTFPKARDDLYYLFTTNVPSRTEIKEILDELKLELPGIATTTWHNMDDEGQKNLVDAWNNESNKYSKEYLVNKKHLAYLDSLVWDNPEVLVRDDSEDTPLAGMPDEDEIVIEPEDTGPEEEKEEDLSEARVGNKVAVKHLSGREGDDSAVPFTGPGHGEEIVYMSTRSGNPPKAFKQYRRSIWNLSNSKSTAYKRLKKLGRNIGVYIIHSNVLRGTILENSFEELYKEDGTVDAEQLVAQIKTYLDKFGLEYKIAEKIAPELVNAIVTGGDEDTERKEGWSMNMGLLNIRVKIYMEPKGKLE